MLDWNIRIFPASWNVVRKLCSHGSTQTGETPVASDSVEEYLNSVLVPMQRLRGGVPLGGDGMFRTLLRIGQARCIAYSLCHFLPASLLATCGSGQASAGRKTTGCGVRIRRTMLPHLSIVAVETGVGTRLTDATTGWESNPTFSADAKQIAYSYTPGKGEHSRIMIGDVNGSNFQCLVAVAKRELVKLFSPMARPFSLTPASLAAIALLNPIRMIELTQRTLTVRTCGN